MNQVIQKEAYRVAVAVKRNISDQFDITMRVFPNTRDTIDAPTTITLSIADAVQGVR